MSEIIKAPMSHQEAVTADGRALKMLQGIARDRELLLFILQEMREREAWRVLGFASHNEYLADLGEKAGWTLRRVQQLDQGSRNLQIVEPDYVNEQVFVNIIPESHVRPLAALESDDDKREAWRIAKATAPGGKVTAAVVKKAVTGLLPDGKRGIVKHNGKLKDGMATCGVCGKLFDGTQLDHCPYCAYTPDQRVEHEQTKQKSRDYITLADWNAGRRVSGATGVTQMNKVNENIEWAAWSWNPVTGCLHNCAYCYARDIANRFYEQGFEPAFIPSRLNAPFNTRQISPRWDGDTGHKNVFVCSMADLFGKWVPEEWINEVLKVIAQTPQWTFLLLTKFPVRMAEFDYPPNVWLGTSVDRQHAVHRAQSAFTKIKASGFDGVCWLSCEPMLERLTFDSLEMFDWVVMGGASKSTQTPEYWPPFEDVLHLYSQAREAGCRVYMKTNLLRLREFPT